MGESQVKLKYGQRELSVTVDTRNLVQVIEPHELEAINEEQEIIRAMNAPIGAPTLQEIVSKQNCWHNHWLHW